MIRCAQEIDTRMCSCASVIGILIVQFFMFKCNVMLAWLCKNKCDIIVLVMLGFGLGQQCDIRIWCCQTSSHKFPSIAKYDSYILHKTNVIPRSILVFFLIKKIHNLGHWFSLKLKNTILCLLVRTTQWLHAMNYFSFKVIS